MNTNPTFERLCAVAIAVLVLGLSAEAQSSLTIDFPKSGMVGKWRVRYPAYPTGFVHDMEATYTITGAKSVVVKFEKGKTATGVLKPSGDGYAAELSTPLLPSGKKDLIQFSMKDGDLYVTLPWLPKPAKAEKLQ